MATSRETFTSAADAYDRHVGRYGAQLAARLVEVADIRPGHRVLDVGCGPGPAGADVNARFVGAHGETPLHWAASSDDVEVTPLADAVAFGQWNAAHRMIEREATPNLRQAAALGQMPRVQERLTAATRPTSEEITNAIWCACHRGQREIAEHLLDQGADINWIGHHDLTPIDAAARSDAHDLVEWLQARGAKPAAQSAPARAQAQLRHVAAAGRRRQHRHRAVARTRRHPLHPALPHPSPR